jgi:transposase
VKFHKRFDQRQAETMRTSFSGLFSGIGLAVILVYLLMVIKFQSWLDPVIVLMAVPFALAGVMWMLFVTQTHVCVPALMGTLMCIGLITANSILVVTFANDRVDAGDDTATAAITAGFTRLRPVLMTAGDGDVFLTYVTEVLAPKLKRGQIVVMDNLLAHKVASIRQAIESTGCRILYLPPYSPDFSPIEPMWSKVKQMLRTLAARTADGLQEAVGTALKSITECDCRGYFKHCGYPL